MSLKVAIKWHYIGTIRAENILEKRTGKMPKYMHQVIIMIEPNDEKYWTNEKIGNLFMNRFTIDEDAAFEIPKIFQLQKTSEQMVHEIAFDSLPIQKDFSLEIEQKGMGFIIQTILHQSTYT